MFGWCGTPETATARPPRNGPMQRQRISEKSFWSNGWRTFWSSCCASATVQKKVQKEIQRIVAPTIPLLQDRKSTRLNSSHSQISYAVFCLQNRKTDRASPHP